MASQLPPSPSGTGGQEPAKNGFLISPDDNANLKFMTRMIWVGGAGRVAVLLLGGDIVALDAVPAGTMLHICAVKVFATGTSATLLWGLY